MKKIKTVDAVGHVLCHDLTQIIKDEVKGAVFKKGHIVREEDIETLLNIGKTQLFVWENKEGMLHENDAAERLANLCLNKNIVKTHVKEGKIDLFADCDGVFNIDKNKLFEINMIEEVMMSSRHRLTPVKKGDYLIGTRVIPLVIDENKVIQAESIVGNEKLIEIFPYKNLKVGIITTGSEVYEGRIKDTFTPVIREKLSNYPLEVIAHETVTDSKEMIETAIMKVKTMGTDLILCTGGMSVDPDDVTPSAIRDTGAEIISYGSPVLPGAMFLVGYYPDDVTVLGLPGCVMYSNATIFDLLLPRVAAKIKISKRDIAELGHGGLCLRCSTCHFPRCEFGKGY